MSTDALAALYTDIERELYNRIGFEADNRIGRGTYLTGTDILPGYYQFVCLETDYFLDGNEVSHRPNNDILIYHVDAESGTEDGEPVFWEQRFDVGAHLVLHLEEGELLEIRGCSGAFITLDPDWGP